MVSSTSKPSPQQWLCLAFRGCNVSTATLLVSAVVVLGSNPSRADAQDISARDVASFFAGAAVGLAVHESGHLILDTAFGADPGIRKVNAGFIPFFAITHHEVTPGKEFLISSAGFWMQEGGNEVLLARYPKLLTARYGFPLDGLEGPALVEAVISNIDRLDDLNRMQERAFIHSSARFTWHERAANLRMAIASKQHG